MYISNKNRNGLCADWRISLTASARAYQKHVLHGQETVSIFVFHPLIGVICRTLIYHHAVAQKTEEQKNKRTGCTAYIPVFVVRFLHCYVCLLDSAKLFRYSSVLSCMTLNKCLLCSLVLNDYFCQRRRRNTNAACLYVCDSQWVTQFYIHLYLPLNMVARKCQLN